MSIITAPRGTRDILPEESYKWSYIVKTASETIKKIRDNLAALGFEVKDTKDGCTWKLNK